MLPGWDPAQSAALGAGAEVNPSSSSYGLFPGWLCQTPQPAAMCKPRQEPALICRRYPRAWPRSLLPPPAVLCPAPEGAASGPDAVPTPGELCTGLAEFHRSTSVQVGTGRALHAARGSHASPAPVPELGRRGAPPAPRRRLLCPRGHRDVGTPAPRVPTYRVPGLCSGRAPCSSGTAPLGDPPCTPSSCLGGNPGGCSL